MDPLSIGLAGASVVTNLFGNYKASRAAKEAAKAQQAALDSAQRRNENFYNRRINEDYTQRSDSQNALNKAKEYALNYSQTAAGKAAVMGSSDAESALAKSEGNKMVGNVASNIAANASDYKDNVENTYFNNAQAIDAARGNVTANMYNAQAKNIAGATGNVSNAIGGYLKNYYAGKIDGIGSNTSTPSNSGYAFTPTLSGNSVGGLNDYSQYFPDYKSQFSKYGTTNATM